LIPDEMTNQPQKTAAERWRKIPWRWRAVLVVLGALVVAQLGVSLVSGIVGSAPAGNPSSSSFATTPTGLAALAQLMNDNGHRIDRLTRPVSDSALQIGSTLFIVDPSGWTKADSAAVRRFVGSGGHVVLAGKPPDTALLAAMFGTNDVPRWQDTSLTVAHAVGSTSVVKGVSLVSTGQAGSISAAGSARPILVGSHGVFAVSGESTVQGFPQAIFVAASAPLTNTDLAQRDNAAFALNLAGPPAAPVAFDEFDHGFGRTGGGLAGLPSWWRWGLGLALGAMIIWLLSAGRRFGPVEAASRQLIPPRMAYADALAAVLAALPDRRLFDSLEPLRTEARQLLCRRSGVQATTDDDELTAAARRTGVPDHVVSSVLDRPDSSSNAVALGAALAWLETHTGVRT
jgi:hypothetical protein